MSLATPTLKNYYCVSMNVENIFTTDLDIYQGIIVIEVVAFFLTQVCMSLTDATAKSSNSINIKCLVSIRSETVETLAKCGLILGV